MFCARISPIGHRRLYADLYPIDRGGARIRIQKSELSIRPIWHQKKKRVQAHILVCFLAHSLWKTLEQWRSRAGLGNSPRTILDELAHIQSADVILPTTESPARQLRLRRVVQPSPEQRALLDRLGLRLPHPAA